METTDQASLMPFAFCNYHGKQRCEWFSVATAESQSHITFVCDLRVCLSLSLSVCMCVIALASHHAATEPQLT